MPNFMRVFLLEASACPPTGTLSRSASTATGLHTGTTRVEDRATFKAGPIGRNWEVTNAFSARPGRPGQLCPRRRPVVGAKSRLLHWPAGRFLDPDLRRDNGPVREGDTGTAHREPPRRWTDQPEGHRGGQGRPRHGQHDLRRSMPSTASAKASPSRTRMSATWRTSIRRSSTSPCAPTRGSRTSPT